MEQIVAVRVYLLMNTAGTLLEKLAVKVSAWAGSSGAFGLALLFVLLWAASGPIFHYSTVWQLVINTGTTIITFLMIFLIQRAQNKDAQALHLKLNELLAAQQGASNRLVNIEDASEQELKEIKQQHLELSQSPDAAPNR